MIFLDKKPIPTKHIEAKSQDDFAKTVVMPGDPKRAEWIAKTFLTDTKLVTSVRGILGFTGKYKGKKVSVMASGMGNPSMGIYSYELFNFYGAENIIRIGTCGTYNKDLNLCDLIVSQKTITNTNYGDMFKNNITEVEASNELINRAKTLCEKNNIKVSFGNIFCTDTFYGGKNEKQIVVKNNCLGMEMESAALYYNAKLSNKNALTICSVSDNLATNKSLNSLEREQSLKNMVTFALELAINE